MVILSDIEVAQHDDNVAPPFVNQINEHTSDRTWRSRNVKDVRNS